MIDASQVAAVHAPHPAGVAPDPEFARSPASERFTAVRELTEALARPLSPEDACVQSMPDASPAKWHLAHTTWFFETFLLAPRLSGYRTPDPAFSVLFNSYYNTVGEQHPRPRRGLLTRPSLERVRAYRAHVDAAMGELFAAGLDESGAGVLDVGLHHEQQHQELLLMDVKHLLAQNPTDPVYHERDAEAALARVPAREFREFDGGDVAIGAEGDGFAFDNERPRHRIRLAPFSIATRPVTNGEYLEFVRDGGYTRPELWLADGWTAVRERGWEAPSYWRVAPDGEATVFTLAGRTPVDPAEPVCHVSYYEADAFARWAGARLPTEGEWETAVEGTPVAGNFLETGRLHPGAAREAWYGDVWEWTQSAYAPYPGYRAPEGALGEYNGKFMCSQLVLRGGCCATPVAHVRATYRNFFYPWMRWQFGGIRLARDV